jgi:hypothetical protein
MVERNKKIPVLSFQSQVEDIDCRRGTVIKNIVVVILGVAGKVNTRAVTLNLKAHCR